MKNVLLASTGLLLVLLSQQAEARIRGGAVAVTPDDTCPNGTANADLDGCEDASPDATFRMSDMDDYFRDEDGNIATLAIVPGHAPGKPYNLPGRDYPIAPRVTVFKDPALYSFTTTGSTVNGTTFTAGTVTSGSVTNGLYLWSSPGTSGQITNGPILSDCIGGGGNGTVCTLSISQSSKSGNYRGSHARGCSWANGGASVSTWTCDFKYPNQALVADFDGFEFGAVGGHTSSRLLVTASDNGVPTLKITNSRIVVDAQTDGQSIIRSNPGVRSNFIFNDNLCDGGNSSVATGEPNPANFNFRIQSGCFSSGFEGISGNHITGSFKRNAMVHWAGNPIQISTAYADIVTQGNVFYRIGMNNGNNTAGGQTGLHGASINWNTTAIGATGSVQRLNDVVIYPWGSRPGVTTAPFALLGGTGSAITIDYKQRLTTAIVNVSEPNVAISSQWFNALRVGALSNIDIKDNYVLTSGIVHNGCYKASGDVQLTAITGSLTASAGNRWSSWNVSGISTAGKEKPYPGQVISNSAGSGARYWFATFADNGNGTSTMEITQTVVGPTNNLTAGWSVVGLGLTDPIVNPTLILSGSGTTYLVSNGSGSGQTLSNRAFQFGMVIQPFGTHGTTATGGALPTNYTGTYSLGVEHTVGSTTTWDAFALVPGNYATLASDIDGNYDVLSGSELLIDGIDLGKGACPGTNAGPS